MDNLANVVKDAIVYLEAFHSDMLDAAGLHVTPMSEDDAPSTYEAVCRAFAEGVYGCYEGASESSIYNMYGSGVVANWEFRTYHDYLHYTQGQDFTIAGEAVLAYTHIFNFRVWALSNKIDADLRRMAERVLLVDTLGQTALFQVSKGGFAIDQSDFLVCALTAPNAQRTLDAALDQWQLPMGGLAYLQANIMDGGLVSWHCNCNTTFQ